MAATLAETLPIRKRSIPLSPRAPRKMQSAFQLEAASTRISRGSPSGMAVETTNPALCNFSVAAVIIRCIHASSFLLNDDRAIVRIDMSEYSEKHSSRGWSARPRAMSATRRAAS